MIMTDRERTAARVYIAEARDALRQCAAILEPHEDRLGTLVRVRRDDDLVLWAESAVSLAAGWTDDALCQILTILDTWDEDEDEES